MDNIRILRLSADDHADPKCRYVGLVQPESRAWRLYVRDDGMPELQIGIVVDDDAGTEINGYIDVRNIPEYLDEGFTSSATPWAQMSDQDKLASWEEARVFAQNNPGYYVDQDEFGRLDVPAKCKHMAMLHPD